MSKPRLQLDGARIDSLAGFYDEVSRSLIPGANWGRNLDAFNDILRGGFGTPEGGFVLVWRESARSRQMLGHPETAQWLEERSRNAHPSNRDRLRERHAEALRGEGETLFDRGRDISGNLVPAAGRPAFAREAEAGISKRGVVDGAARPQRSPAAVCEAERGRLTQRASVPQ